MAFFIFDNDGKINKIAADTSARDAQNVFLTVKETSEDNFIKLKSNTHTARDRDWETKIKKAI